MHCQCLSQWPSITYSIILKDSCLVQHKYVPLTPIRVTAINAPLRTACHIKCRGKSALK